MNPRTQMWLGIAMLLGGTLALAATAFGTNATLSNKLSVAFALLFGLSNTWQGYQKYRQSAAIPTIAQTREIHRRNNLLLTICIPLGGLAGAGFMIWEGRSPGIVLPSIIFAMALCLFIVYLVRRKKGQVGQTPRQ